MRCLACGARLRESQWSKQQRFKSCPSCSQEQGAHVFYPLHEGFGVTDKRASSIHPEGPQSHCIRCRGRGGTPPPVACGDVESAELSVARASPPRIRRGR